MIISDLMAYHIRLILQSEWKKFTRGFFHLLGCDLPCRRDVNCRNCSTWKSPTQVVTIHFFWILLWGHIGSWKFSELLGNEGRTSPNRPSVSLCPNFTQYRRTFSTHGKIDEKSNLRRHHYDFKAGNAIYMRDRSKQVLPQPKRQITIFFKNLQNEK